MTINPLRACTFAALGLASTTAMADVDVYGRISLALQNADEAGVSQVELRNNNSRFGVKGSEDLGEGLKAIYQFEWQVDVTDNGNSSDNHIKARNQFAGLQGGFGTLKVGRHDTALKLTQGDFDLFNDLEGDIGIVLNGENRVSNFIGYTTPSFGGLSATVNLIPGEDAAAGEDGVADATSFSIDYANDNWYASIGRDSDIEGAGIDTTRVVGGYKLGDARFNLLYQRTETPIDEADGYGASFAYAVDRHVFKAQYLTSDIHEVGVGVSHENVASLGYEYKLAKSTKLFGYYTTADIAASNESSDYLGIGMEHRF